LKEFNKALSNFINDAAVGGAIRHLADLGYSISQISDSLDYPLPKDKIASIIWEHFLNIGKISLKEPNGLTEKVSFIKEQDAYGKTSFRKVVEPVDNSNKKYIQVNYGRLLYKKDPEFLARLNELSLEDREYIELIPWPLTPVYHQLDERMERMHKILK